MKVAAPVFLLERTDLSVLNEVQKENTVGINVILLIMKYGAEGNLILDNCCLLIRYILEKTDRGVCQIPYVLWRI